MLVTLTNLSQAVHNLLIWHAFTVSIRVGLHNAKLFTPLQLSLSDLREWNLLAETVNST